MGKIENQFCNLQPLGQMVWNFFIWWIIFIGESLPKMFIIL
jgi:hypothetical protein